MQDWSNSFTPGNTYVKDADGNYVFAPGGRAGVPGQTTYGNHEGSSNVFSFTQPNQVANASFGAGTSQAGQPTTQTASSGGAFGGGTGHAQQSSPHLGNYANSITQQVTQNLQRNILPQLRGTAQSVGGFGGSRQGVVEANALNDANQGLSNALAGAYSQDWNAQQGRNLQQYGMDQSYNLGLGSLGLNSQNSQNNFYTAQRGQDLQQMGLGSQLAQSANQGYLNQGSGVYDVGSQYQNAPWQTMGNFNSAATPYTGYGATSTTSQGTNPWAQALGGAAMGAQLGRLF